MTDKTEPLGIADLAFQLERLITGVTHFTEEEADALNKLKTAIFVNLTQKNLEDFGISRPRG